MQKVIISTAMFLFTATSLIANPFGKNHVEKIDLELNKNIVNTVVEIANEGIEHEHIVLTTKVMHSISIQHSVIKNIIVDKIKKTERWDAVKYSHLYSAFAELEVLTDREYWKNIPQNKFGQEIINAVNNLEKAIKDLPLNDEKNLYFDKLANIAFYFHYNGKVLNISKLFELAKSYSGNLEARGNKLTEVTPLELTVEEYAKKNNLE